MSRFDEFWAAYPKKQGKGAVQRKWDDRKLDSLADFIIPHVNKRKLEDEQWLKGYIPMPLTFLNQDRWTDEYEVAKKRQTQTTPIDHDPTIPNPGLLGSARYWDVCSDGLTSEQIERLIWAKKLGGIHLEQLPESHHHLLNNIKAPF